MAAAVFDANPRLDRNGRTASSFELRNFTGLRRLCAIRKYRSLIDCHDYYLMTVCSNPCFYNSEYLLLAK